MAVSVSLEFPVSTADYDKVHTAAVGESPPDGLLVHTARDDGGVIRIFDVWESADAFGAFAEQRLGPALGEVFGDDAPGPPQPEIHELHNLTRA
jgi:hypothetical protein